MFPCSMLPSTCCLLQATCCLLPSTKLLPVCCPSVAGYKGIHVAEIQATCCRQRVTCCPKLATILLPVTSNMLPATCYCYESQEALAALWPLYRRKNSICAMFVCLQATSTASLKTVVMPTTSKSITIFSSLHIVYLHVKLTDRLK